MLFLAARRVRHTHKIYPIGHTIPEFGSWPSFVQERLIREKYVHRISDEDDPGIGTGITYESDPEKTQHELKEEAEHKADQDEAVISAQAAVRIQGVDTVAAAASKGIGTPVPCDQCELTFKNRTGLAHHKRAAHPDDDD